MKIITDVVKLKNPVYHKNLDSKQIEDISTILLTELKRHGGIGLSANQLGLDVRVCVVNVIEPLILVNPVIVEKSKDVVAYVEQCLSIPKSKTKPVKTIRHKTVKINTDNLGIIEFGPTMKEGRPWKDSNEFFSDQGMLECVCVQHEIDHLDGFLMTHSSRRYSSTLTAPKKYGRNEKVMVKLPDGSTEFMKYKNALPLTKIGCEIL